MSSKDDFEAWLANNTPLTTGPRVIYTRAEKELLSRKDNTMTTTQVNPLTTLRESDEEIELPKHPLEEHFQNTRHAIKGEELDVILAPFDVDMEQQFDVISTPADIAMWVAANANIEVGSRNEDRFRYFNAENHHPARVPLVVHTNYRKAVKGVVAYRTTDPKGNEITLVTSFAPTESFDIIKTPKPEDVSGLLTRVGEAHNLGDYIGHWSSDDVTFLPLLTDITGNMNDKSRKLHLHPRVMVVKGVPSIDRVWLLMRER